jgi:nucleotide-binding universal stress UspA family protein
MEAIMPVKLILCPFRGEARELNVLASAFQIAPAHEAGLRILHMSAPPPVYSAIGLRGGVSIGGHLEGTEDLLEAAERDMIAISEHYARQYAQRADLTFRIDGGDPTGPQTADVLFRARVGNLEDRLPLESRTCDLILMGFDNQPDGQLSDVIAALFRMRRPVLLVPRKPGAVVAGRGRPKTVAIAWDGSQACAQAVHDAIPFLAMAAEIFVLHVTEPGKDADETDLKAYLHCHGLAAEFIHIPRNDGSIGKTLLDQALAVDVNLLVMGAYGHGQMVEMVLGGATEFVLKHAHIPLLMAH